MLQLVAHRRLRRRPRWLTSESRCLQYIVHHSRHSATNRLPRTDQKRHTNRRNAGARRRITAHAQISIISGCDEISRDDARLEWRHRAAD